MCLEELNLPPPPPPVLSSISKMMAMSSSSISKWARADVSGEWPPL